MMRCDCDRVSVSVKVCSPWPRQVLICPGCHAMTSAGVE